MNIVTIKRKIVLSLLCCLGFVIACEPSKVHERPSVANNFYLYTENCAEGLDCASDEAVKLIGEQKEEKVVPVAKEESVASVNKVEQVSLASEASSKESHEVNHPLFPELNEAKERFAALKSGLIDILSKSPSITTEEQRLVFTIMRVGLKLKDIDEFLGKGRSNLAKDSQEQLRKDLAYVMEEMASLPEYKNRIKSSTARTKPSSNQVTPELADSGSVQDENDQYDSSQWLDDAKAWLMQYQTKWPWLLLPIALFFIIKSIAKFRNSHDRYLKELEHDFLERSNGPRKIKDRRFRNRRRPPPPPPPPPPAPPLRRR